MHDEYRHNGHMHHGYIHHGYMHHRYMHHSCTDTCIIDIEVDKEVLVLVTFAWVTRPERPKGAKDEVKRPEGPPTRSRGQEGP